MTTKVDFYWLPHCTTCQKARTYLDNKGVEIAHVRDIKSEPLNRAEVEKLARMVGGPESLFSKRAIKYRELRLAERALSNDELIRLMTEEYTFIKRPIIVLGDKAVSGFNAKQVDSFISAGK
jgi:arsenate reductase